MRKLTSTLFLTMGLLAAAVAGAWAGDAFDFGDMPPLPPPLLDDTPLSPPVSSGVTAGMPSAPPLAPPPSVGGGDAPMPTLALPLAPPPLGDLDSLAPLPTSPAASAVPATPRLPVPGGYGTRPPGPAAAPAAPPSAQAGLRPGQAAVERRPSLGLPSEIGPGSPASYSQTTTTTVQSVSQPFSPPPPSYTYSGGYDSDSGGYGQDVSPSRTQAYGGAQPGYAAPPSPPPAGSLQPPAPAAALAPPMAETPLPAKISGGRVNVRAGPNTQYESIAVLGSGTPVTVMAKNNEWYKILFPADQLASIHKNLVDADVQGEIPEAGVVGVVNKSDADVHAYYWDKSTVVGKLNRGDQVLIKQERGQWYRIVPPDSARAYVSEKYVKLDNAGAAGRAAVAVDSAPAPVNPAVSVVTASAPARGGAPEPVGRLILSEADRQAAAIKDSYYRRIADERRAREEAEQRAIAEREQAIRNQVQMAQNQAQAQTMQFQATGGALNSALDTLRSRLQAVDTRGSGPIAGYPQTGAAYPGMGATTTTTTTYGGGYVMPQTQTATMTPNPGGGYTLTPPPGTITTIDSSGGYSTATYAQAPAGSITYAQTSTGPATYGGTSYSTTTSSSSFNAPTPTRVGGANVTGVYATNTPIGDPFAAYSQVTYAPPMDLPPPTPVPSQNLTGDVFDVYSRLTTTNTPQPVFSPMMDPSNTTYGQSHGYNMPASTVGGDPYAVGGGMAPMGGMGMAGGDMLGGMVGGAGPGITYTDGMTTTTTTTTTYDNFGQSSPPPADPYASFGQGMGAATTGMPDMYGAGFGQGGTTYGGDMMGGNIPADPYGSFGQTTTTTTTTTSGDPYAQSFGGGYPTGMPLGGDPYAGSSSSSSFQSGSSYQSGSSFQSGTTGLPAGGEDPYGIFSGQSLGPLGQAAGDVMNQVNAEAGAFDSFTSSQSFMGTTGQGSSGGPTYQGQPAFVIPDEMMQHFQGGGF